MDPSFADMMTQRHNGNVCHCSLYLHTHLQTHLSTTTQQCCKHAPIHALLTRARTRTHKPDVRLHMRKKRKLKSVACQRGHSPLVKEHKLSSIGCILHTRCTGISDGGQTVELIPLSLGNCHWMAIKQSKVSPSSTPNSLDASAVNIDVSLTTRDMFIR